jgi:serine/threonine protein kinase
MNRGHNACADHWSMGILIFEMLTGETPFYKHGMEQMDLFRAIVKGRFTPPTHATPEAVSIIKALLARDPAQRLGSLAGGEDDILMHPWFKSINFDELELKTIAPPKVPKVKNLLDASNFEDWSRLEDKSKQKFPNITTEQKEIFTVSSLFAIV